MSAARLPKKAEGPQRKITFRRTFDGSFVDVWNLWTTKDGFESWWGPEGFATTLRKLDIRPGGEFEYAMTATGPDQINAMKAAGVNLTTVTRGTFTGVVPRRRLEYKTLVDFIPGIDPYQVATVVELHGGSGGVRMVVTEDAMHDQEWTRLSVLGMNSSLDRLRKVVEARAG